ncbi:MAG: hypothetical protein ABEJ05_09330 [Haloglomus sp.]
MSRSDETEYDSDVDIDALLDEGAPSDRQQAGERTADEGVESEASGETTGGLRSRLPSPSLPSLPGPEFTLRGLGVAFVACVVAFVAAGVVVPVGGIAGLVGVFVAGFVLGLVGRGRYLELALAGASTAAVGALLDQLLLATLANVAVPLAAVGGTAGLFAAVLGCYFGRDLRGGLTRSV